MRARAVLAIAADRRIDDARIERGDRFVVDAECRDDAGPEALDDHVGAPRKGQERVASAGILEIDGEAPLVAVDRAVDGGNRPLLRAEIAKVVAGAGSVKSSAGT